MVLTSIDPLRLAAEMWPKERFYDKQREVIMSVEESKETYVVAGNKLGKDYIAGYIVTSLFLRCLKVGKTCRIVTTSVADHHLKVLWGEVGRWVTTCKYPLLHKHGGPLIMNHMELRRASEWESKNHLNYAVGRVSAKGEGLAGHHAEITLFVADEASGVDDVAYEMAQGWASRLLVFGNPNPTSNFFYRGIMAGDLLAC